MYYCLVIVTTVIIVLIVYLVLFVGFNLYIYSCSKTAVHYSTVQKDKACAQ